MTIDEWWKFKKIVYGVNPHTGGSLEPPDRGIFKDDWVLLPEGTEVPQEHVVCYCDFVTGQLRWEYYRCRSTMTPIHACLWGHAIGYFVKAIPLSGE